MRSFVTVLVFLLITVWSTTASENMCPEKWFDVIVPVTADQLILSNVSFLDSNFRYLREVLNNDDDQIDEVTQSAMDFFKTRFGLDFSNSEPNSANIRFHQNSTFFPYDVSADIYTTFNRWLVNGQLGANICTEMLEGGFTVITRDTQVLYGTYGGEQGKILPPRAELDYAFFRLDICPQQPTIIQCQSITPTTTNMDGLAPRYFECFNQFLGRGLIQGLRGTFPTEDPRYARISVRHTMTFPASLQ